MKQWILLTDHDGKARFVEQDARLDTGTPLVRLSDLFTSSGYQFRESPIGYESAFHCTEHPQWIVILQGVMEITLQDGSSRRFKAGEYFFCADVLPAEAPFDPKVHGHRSRQIGDEVLQTLFVRG